MAKAFIVFTDGTHKAVPLEKGLALWRVLNGECQPANKAQAAYAERVQDMFMSYKLAPKSYRDKHRDSIAQLTLLPGSGLGGRHITN